jgi:hypothetical protein
MPIDFGGAAGQVWGNFSSGAQNAMWGSTMRGAGMAEKVASRLPGLRGPLSGLARSGAGPMAFAALGAAPRALKLGAMAGIGGAAVGALSPWNTMGGGFRGAIGGGIKWGIGGGLIGAAAGGIMSGMGKGGLAGVGAGMLRGLGRGAKWGSMFGAAKGAVLGNRPMNPIYGLQY